MTDKEQDNIIRWDGSRRGWYEVYYLKFNDLVSGTAYWIRYTMTSPLSGGPYCELWGIFFDAADPSKNFAVKDRFGIERLSVSRDRFRMGVGEAELLMNSCKGSITDAAHGNSLSWEIEFDSKGETFRHFPSELMYRAALPKTKVLSPHEDCRFSGTVRANGREIILNDAPGQQTHIWGTKHALRWAWGHCNAFEDEDVVWEGLDSQIMLGPFESPHVNLFYLRYKGRDFLFNSLGQLFWNRSNWTLGNWSFEARSKDLTLKGEVSCKPEQMVAVTYTDPDGDNLWCNNSKIARIRLELIGPDGKPVAELVSESACAAEFVDRRIYPEVPVRI